MPPFDSKAAFLKTQTLELLSECTDQFPFKPYTASANQRQADSARQLLNAEFV